MLGYSGSYSTLESMDCSSLSFLLSAILYYRHVFTPLLIAIAMDNLKLEYTDAVFCCFVATFPVFYLAARTLFCFV